MQPRQPLLGPLGDVAGAEAQNIQQSHVVGAVDETDQLGACKLGLGSLRMTSCERRNRHGIVALADLSPFSGEPRLSAARGWARRLDCALVLSHPLSWLG